MASTVLPNGIIIPEKYSRDWYNDLYHNWQELDNLLSASPGDGTLTIQKNGTTVGTFSANQATDETINISVPTKTSDLTNDSNFVQSSDLATVATSGSYADLSNKPTIPTKTSDLNNDSGFITEDNTKIPLSGSNAISGSLIPATTDAYDLGGSSYQWNNAYIKSLTINGVACGDILSHNVSEFVNVTGAQTIGGVKTFSDGLFASKSTAGELAILEDNSINSTNEDANGMPLTGHTNSLKIKGSQVNVIPCMLTGQVFTSGDTSAELLVYKYKDTSRKAGFNIRYMYASGVAQAQFSNCNIITSANGVYNIGASKARWKSCYTNAINGIAPDELGLPTSTYTDVSSYITNFDSTPNTFTAPVSGLLNIITSYTGDIACSVFDNTTGIQVGGRDASGQVRVLLPLEQGNTITVYMSKSGLAYARIYHLKGKV